MKTNLSERLIRYRCFIRPKVHFVPKFSFKVSSSVLDGCNTNNDVRTDLNRNVYDYFTKKLKTRKRK